MSDWLKLLDQDEWHLVYGGICPEWYQKTFFEWDKKSTQLQNLLLYLEENHVITKISNKFYFFTKRLLCIFQ